MGLTMMTRPGNEAVYPAAVAGSGESTGTGHPSSMGHIVEVKLVIQSAKEGRKAG